MQFDWQTDEEDWEHDPPAPTNTAVSSPRFPHIWLALAGLLLLSAAAIYIYRQAINQVNTTTTRLSTELLTTYDLLNSAVYQNDLELFKSFLSDRNTYSRELPLELFRYGYFLDRPFLNLTALERPFDQEPKVEFSPDLTRAEVVTLQAYQDENDPSADPVWLERLTLFRKDDDRWQLTRWPIDESFWGETAEERIGLLTAEFPTRDEDYGRRLAQDVSLLLDDICTNDAISCPPNFRLKMLLVPYGQNLLDMNNNYRTLPLSSGYDAYRIFLPTPTLVGRPVDEAGYDVFYRGYAGWIAAVLVQHYSRVRPVTSEVTADFLTQWQLTPPPTAVLPGPVTEPAEVEPVEPPPIPLPDQDMLLVCQGYSPPIWLAYNPAGDTWLQIPAPNNAPALAQLLQQAGDHSRFAPEGQGSLIRRPLSIGSVQFWQSYLWLGGLTNLLVTNTGQDLYLADPRHQLPDGDHLLFYPFDGQGNPYLGQTAACLAGNCRLEPLAGVPVWSPSGQATLLSHRRGDGLLQIYLGSEQARPVQYLIDGYSPQWLDESNFLFIGGDGRDIFNGRINQATSTLDQVESITVSGLGLPENLVPTSITVHPTQPDWIFLITTHQGDRQDSLLLYNRQANTLDYWYTTTNLRLALPIYLTEDGRFLTLLAFERDSLSGGWYIMVFGLDQLPKHADFWQFSTNTAYFDWSDDGQWLLAAEENALRLITPHLKYERQIPHNLGCHTVGWAENGGQ